MDFVTDLNCRYAEYAITDPVSSTVIARGYVHSGMMQVTTKVSEKVKAKLQSLCHKLPTYELILTGHSLGGGVTALLTLLWLSDRDMSKVRYRGLAFATPQVISENFNQYVKGRLTSCLIGNDLVPRLSFGTSKDLCQIVEAMNNIEVRSR